FSSTHVASWPGRARLPSRAVARAVEKLRKKPLVEPLRKTRRSRVGTYGRCSGFPRRRGIRRCRGNGGGDDPQAQSRRIPALFAQSQSEDRPQAQSRHIQVTRGGREARARGAVLQAPLRETSARDKSTVTGG